MFKYALAVLPLLSLPTLSAPVEGLAPAIQARGRYNEAASIATWDSQCYNSDKHDQLVPDGVCYYLPGQGFTTWWLNSNCYVHLFKSSSCQGEYTEVGTGNLQQCYDARNLYSYQIYC